MPWSCVSAQYVLMCGGTTGLCSISLKSSPLAFQWSIALRGVEHVDAADHLVDRAEAERGHDLAQPFGDQEEVVDHVLRLCR